MSVLPDTSIWVGYFRGGDQKSTDEMSALIHDDEAVMCGPVLAELVVGTKPESRVTLYEAVAGLRWASLSHRAWRRVGEVGSALRAAGMSVPLTDIEIAVSAVEADAALWSLDTDFERVATAVPELRLHRP
ncbi:MAG: PIN domain-containing protein [Actinobacteria bacterium]|nr:PIN domain-containing protein [Actinomycetota bacterium]